IFDQSDWVNTVSKELANHWSDHISTIKRSAIFELYQRRAETEFLEGKRDDITLTPEEISEVDGADKKLDLFISVKSSFIRNLIPQIILVSKSELLNYKYILDTRDKTDNNNLRLAREIADSVYQLLPNILAEVQKEVLELGEN